MRFKRVAKKVMRFKKGSKVEVLNKREAPSGSWLCAEIVSGNGHNYHVRYDHYLPDIGSAMEKVPRNAIRPRPPSVGGQRNWVPGDIVEAFENNSWKPAEVSRVVNGNYYFVIVHGFSNEFLVHASDLRLRQYWQDNRWVLIEKEFAKCDDGKTSKPSEVGQISNRKRHRGTEMKSCRGEDQIFTIGDNSFEEQYWGSSRGMKKRPRFCLSSIEKNAGSCRKNWPVKKGGKLQRLGGMDSSRLPKKVDAVASPQIMLGEKDMHASLNNKTKGFSKVGLDWGDPNADVVHFVVGSLDLDGCESPSSSVGSFSPCSSPYRALNKLKTSPTQDVNVQPDDVGSLCGSGREPSLPTNEELTTDVHQLELCAYRSTMVALYASGPLSWEREALMTNLRLMLHISNDEHLQELRHLASMGTDSS